MPSFCAANEMEANKGELIQVGEVDEVILKAPKDKPFSLVHELAWHICLP
jgi:hypothetical protein